MPAADLKWTPGAIACFRAYPWPNWREAARIDAAILRFAEQGEGDVEQVAGDPRGFRLRVPPYAVRFEVDPEGTLITILGVFREG
jgi:hypothetical protein